MVPKSIWLRAERAYDQGMTAGRRSTTICIFCEVVFVLGRRGEDIVPQWYAKEIGHRAGHVTLAVFDHIGESALQSRPTQTVAAKEFRLRDVCRDCNGGWMSTLEATAKPILLPLMRGETTLLTPVQQRVVASWVQLKAICWDAVLGVDRQLDASVAHAFYSLQPLSWEAALLSVESYGPTDITFARHVGMATTSPDQALIVFRASIIFNQLMISASTPLEAAPPPQVLLSMVSEGFEPIWPPVVDDPLRTIVWPPAKRFTKDQTARLM